MCLSLPYLLVLSPRGYMRAPTRIGPAVAWSACLSCLPAYPAYPAHPACLPILPILPIPPASLHACLRLGPSSAF